jgi:hypothetical protein
MLPSTALHMSKPMHESFTTKTGRVIHYTYGKRPGESKPCLVILYAVFIAPTGPRLLMNKIPLLGRLNKWELEREADHLERRVEAVQRGEQRPAAPGEEAIDLKDSDWPEFLRANPVVVEAYPQTLHDLVGDDDEQH